MDMQIGRGIFSDDLDDLARLSHLLERVRPTMHEIKQAICEFYCIDRREIESETRRAFIVLARQMFCYFARKYTTTSSNSATSLRRIGIQVGGLDHTTVLHSVRKVEQLAALRPLIADDLDLIRLRIADKVMHRIRVVPREREEPVPACLSS